MPTLFTPASACLARALPALVLACGLGGWLHSPAARAAELAPALARLATCEESWYDLRKDNARMSVFAEALRTQFRPQDRSPVWKPIERTTWLGAEILEITPQSVGMGLGFAVTLKLPYAQARPAYERVLGQTMARCEASDGLHSCERTLAPKRTALIMAPQHKPELGTLLGCYYFYEQ
jgi:hypothetical protein